MFAPYTVYHSSRNKLWFVSDPHFCHDREFLYSKRGFKNIEEHDATLIERWNNKVAPNDQIVMLGDFILGAGRDSTVACESLLKTLNGNKLIIWGNHNSGLKQVFRKLVLAQYGREDIEVYPIETSEFGGKVCFMGNNLLLKVKRDTPMCAQTRFVFCSHFAHRIWIDMNRDIWHLSGHSHGSDPESQPDFLGTKRLDVGIENFGGPISFDEVAEIMHKKQISTLDHHTANTSPSF
jgi:calcineurin-like phosphoesterase family protein